MTLFKKAFVLTILSSTLICVTGRSADEDTLGDLGIRVRQQNLDSYWLNTKPWMEYGYRPHVTSNLTRFTSLPSVFAGRNYYAYGTNPGFGTSADSLGTLNKDDIQMTKYGTWH